MPKLFRRPAGELAPQVALLKEQMAVQYDLDNWDNKRVDRLCQGMGITLESLCAAAGLFDPAEIRKLRKQADARQALEAEHRAYANHMGHFQERRFPVEARKSWKWPWPIALHFSRMERFYYEHRMMTPSQVSPEDAYLARLVEEAPLSPNPTPTTL